MSLDCNPKGCARYVSHTTLAWGAATYNLDCAAMRLY